MNLELPIADAALLVEGSDWCTVSLRLGSSVTKLGAESFRVLAPKILANLSSPSRSASWEMDGRAVHWVASFAEDHSTLYVHFAPSHRELYIQSSAGAPVWNGILSDEQFKQWEKALGTYA